MPRFEPFAAVRFAPSVPLDQVIAPPYDVINDDDVEALEHRDTHNISWLDDPRGGQDRYEIAAQTLNRWLDEGILIEEDEPSFTIYRMAFTDATGTDRMISGVMGGLEVVDEGAGGVLPHEHTTKKAVTDRLDLTRATHTNLSPVWGLSLAEGLTQVLAAPGEPLGSVRVEGVRHCIERVTDPARISAIQTVLAADDVLLADGHHRYAISRTYRDEVRAATGRTDTSAEFTLAFVNELVEHQLSIEAIHRLVDGIGFGELRTALARHFEIESIGHPVGPATLAQMVDLGRLVLLAPDATASWLIAKPGAFDDVRALDGAWLEKALGDTGATISYQHGLAEMTREVANHAGGILIRPTGLEEIMRTAREGLLMPPKSTFFTPKLRTGFAIRRSGEF
ncbi:Uncharacterized conserved protein, DUF1015 family [Propionibacterium cyclohexanicum]|uniref:Uncharacterized conserved protein, DUF1015 family n=1 Tax=Propionibacterium cyclohexanicum TaxID=64702 RepID=A0A1H9RX87_9ACTN|nr:DUF1015 domain-containing protein [Propionibacterium cyclohexanicum]SER77392.1 Uncharacterized conserved protein, DUF1015 family [Propionibacterium cyclohexanicum]